MCIHMQQQLVIKGRSALRNIVHCCTIFLKSSGYRNRHRNPNINKNVRGHNMKKKKTTKNKVRGNVGRSLQMGFWQLDSVATTYIQCNGYFDVAPTAHIAAYWPRLHVPEFTPHTRYPMQSLDWMTWSEKRDLLHLRSDSTSWKWKLKLCNRIHPVELVCSCWLSAVKEAPTF